MQRPLLIAVLASLACVPMAVPAAERITWMYEADVPVANQSAQARIEAAQAGLRQVLGRLTGQGEQGEGLQLSDVSADRLMNRFSYHSAVFEGRRQPRIKLDFNPAQTLAAVRKAGLPVWSSSRPLVKLYLIVEEEDGSRSPLLENDPARVAMERQAWIRGLVLAFPAFDEAVVPIGPMLEEVDPAQLGQRETAAETPLPEPLPEPSPELPPEPFLPGVIPAHTELVVVGELRRVPPATDGPQNVAFRYAMGSTRGGYQGVDTTVEAQATDLVDRIASTLAGSLAVRWLAPRSQAVTVSGIGDVADYAALMRYFGRLEYLARVDLVEAGRDRLELSLLTPADPAQLDLLFLVDGRIARVEEDALHVQDALHVPGAESERETSRLFSWQD